MKSLASTASVLLLCSCAARRPLTFEVLPASPNYVLRSPDHKDTPFPEVPANFTKLAVGWVDLQRDMGIRIENAYWREGSPKRGIQDFLGTEVAQYNVSSKGALRLAMTTSDVREPPADQPPVEQLMPPAQQTYPQHRFFYQIAFKKQGDRRGAVLLGAASEEELERLGGTMLEDPDSVCGRPSGPCTVFPQTCSVSVQMQIYVDGVRRTVLWANMLSSVAPHPKRIELLRRYNGRLRPVKLDPADPDALRLPLLPGDRVRWK